MRFLNEAAEGLPLVVTSISASLIYFNIMTRHICDLAQAAGELLETLGMVRVQ